MASGHSPSLVGHMSTYVSVPCLSGPTLPLALGILGGPKPQVLPRQMQEDLDQLELHSEFKASLAYKGPPLS